jgi:cytochrome P450
MNVTQLDLPEVDMLSAGYEADPAGAFRAAREQSWLARVGDVYGVLTHADARALMKHPDFRVSFAYIEPSLSQYLHDRQRSGLMSSSGERHVRLRGAAVRALRPHIVDALREAMREVIDELLDAALAGDAVDLVAAVTDPYPARVMTPILGVPAEDVPRIDRWASDSVAIFDVPRLPTQAPRIEASGREFEAYARELIGSRRGQLGSDIVSELIRAQEEGEELSDDELVMLVTSLIGAALDTTRGQLGMTMECLVRNPEQWAKLVADPGLAARAVEEGLRYAPAVSGISHEAVRDTEHNGVGFPAGTRIAIYPRSTNRDAAAYDNPDDFDIEREPSLHFTFGFGPHACLGARVARLEMAEALAALAARVATWELNGEVTHLPMSSNGNRLSLPVRFRALARS